MSEIRIPREMVKEVDDALQRCVLRLQASKAPESRAIGIEAEEVLLQLAEAVGRYDKLVELHGGEGRRHEYVEASGDLLPFATAKEY